MAQTPNTPKKFAVVKFKQLPIESMSDTECVPNSWIKCYFEADQVGVAFPLEMTAKNKTLMRNGKEPVQKWDIYPATIERRVNSYKEWEKSEAEAPESPLVPQFENLNIHTPSTSKEPYRPKNLQNTLNTSDSQDLDHNETEPENNLINEEENKTNNVENSEGDVNVSVQPTEEPTEDIAPPSNEKRCDINTQHDEFHDLRMQREKVLIEREKNLLEYERKIHNLQEEKLKLEIDILKSKRVTFLPYIKTDAGTSNEAKATSNAVKQFDERLLQELYQTWQHMNSLMEQIFKPENNPN